MSAPAKPYFYIINIPKLTILINNTISAVTDLINQLVQVLRRELAQLRQRTGTGKSGRVKSSGTIGRGVAELYNKTQNIQDIWNVGM